MSENASDFAVGAFVIAMLAALVFWIAVLSGRTGATDSYYILYDNVMGVAPGTQVLFEGYPIGVVAARRPQQGPGPRFRVDIDVDEDWPIPEDSKAAVTASGLLSAIVIDVRAGSSPTLLEPGDEVPGSASASVMAALSGVAGELTELIDGGLRPLLDQLVDDAPNILENVRDFTGDLKATVAQLNQILRPETVARVDRILGSVDGATTNLGAVAANLGGTQKRLDDVLVSVDRLLDSDDGALNDAVYDLRETLAAVASRVNSIAHNVDVTSRNLSEFSRQVRENPGVLVRGRDANGDPQ